MSGQFNPPLQVIELISSRRGDDDRGPVIWMRPDEARLRMLMEGELAWVHTPRRNELAEVRTSADIPRGAAVVRDIFGVTVSEIVTVRKPDLDTPPRRDLA